VKRKRPLEGLSREERPMQCHAMQRNAALKRVWIRATGQVFGAERLALVAGAHLPPTPRTCTTDRGTHFTKPNALILGSKLSRHCFTYTFCRADTGLWRSHPRRPLWQALPSSRLALAALRAPFWICFPWRQHRPWLERHQHFGHEVHCTSLEQTRTSGRRLPQLPTYLLSEIMMAYGISTRTCTIKIERKRKHRAFFSQSFLLRHCCLSSNSSCG
jgi:hypothetical protein